LADKKKQTVFHLNNFILEKKTIFTGCSLAPNQDENVVV